MRRLGIIAADDERIQEKRKWYQFFKKSTNFDCQYIKEWNLALTTVYLPYEAETLVEVEIVFLSNWVRQVETFFKEQEIGAILYSSRVRSTLMDKILLNEVKLYDGQRLLSELIPRIVGHITKNMSATAREGTLLYVDNNLDRVSARTFKNIGRDWKYLSIVTENMSRAKEISRDIFAEYGMTVDICERDDRYFKCDVAILKSGRLPKLSRNAFVVNLSDEKSMLHRGKAVDKINVNFENPFKINIEKFDGLEALAELGILNPSRIENMQISFLGSHGNVVKI